MVSAGSSGSARRTWRASESVSSHSSGRASSVRSDVPSPAASEFLRRKHAQMKAKAAALSPPRPSRLQAGQGPGQGLRMARVDPRVATVRGVSSVTDVAALFPSLAATHTASNSRKDKDLRQQPASRSTPAEKEERRLAAVRLAASVSSSGAQSSPPHQSGGRVYSLLMSPERRQRAGHASSSQTDHRQRPLVSTWMTVGGSATGLVEAPMSYPRTP